MINYEDDLIKIFKEEGISVLNGRYGPYVTDGTKNARIPKETDPLSLTLEECQTMIAEAPASRRGKKASKKASKKTTTSTSTKKTTTKKASKKKTSKAKKSKTKKKSKAKKVTKSD